MPIVFSFYYMHLALGGEEIKEEKDGGCYISNTKT
jgi:hypothetical protein